MQNESLHPGREQSVGALSRSMLVVMILTMVSKIAGFLRETVFAATFGAGAIKSAFSTADLLPCIALSVVAISMAATLIPVYADQRKLGKGRADRFIGNLYTVGMAISVLILLLTWLFLQPLTDLVMQGSDDMETRRLAVELAQIMMPMGIFVFLTRVSSAYLQANFNFTIPAVSQVFYNVIIISAIVLSRGADVRFVAIGTVLGWAMQFLVQVPAIRKTDLRFRPVFDLKDPGLRQVLILVLPILVSSLFDQVYLLFDQTVAYRGNIADAGNLVYANRLSTMVSAVLLTTVATVLYPNLVKNVDNQKRFTNDLSFGVNLIVMIALPAMAALILLCLPITRAVYQRRAFGAEDTLAVGTLLACYSAGIFGIGLREICNRCFYAYKDTIVPTVTGIGIVVLNVVLNYTLHAVFGVAGIAAATSISNTASGLLLLSLLRRKKGVVDTGRIGRCLWKTALSTAVMTVVALALFSVFSLGTATGLTLWIRLAATFVVGVVVYLGMLFVLRTDELAIAADMIKKRLRR